MFHPLVAFASIFLLRHLPWCFTTRWFYYKIILSERLSASTFRFRPLYRRVTNFWQYMKKMHEWNKWVNEWYFWSSLRSSVDNGRFLHEIFTYFYFPSISTVTVTLLKKSAILYEDISKVNTINKYNILLKIKIVKIMSKKCDINLFFKYFLVVLKINLVYYI